MLVVLFVVLAILLFVLVLFFTKLLFIAVFSFDMLLDCTFFVLLLVLSLFAYTNVENILIIINIIITIKDFFFIFALPPT